jgi:hypothetical protein
MIINKYNDNKYIYIYIYIYIYMKESKYLLNIFENILKLLIS